MDAERFWYHFSLLSSAISEQLSQLHQPLTLHLLQPTLTHLTTSLDCPPVEAALIALGLLKDNQTAAVNAQVVVGDGGVRGLNLTSGCCIPPRSRDSQLARLGLHLFQTKVPVGLEA